MRASNVITLLYGLVLGLRLKAFSDEQGCEPPVWHATIQKIGTCMLFSSSAFAIVFHLGLAPEILLTWRQNIFFPTYNGRS